MVANITPEFLNLIKLPDENSKKLNYLMISPMYSPQYPHQFPVGQGMITAALKASGRSVQILQPETYDELYQQLPELLKSIDVVMLGGFACFFQVFSDILSLVKSIDDRIVTICGGG